ncbi:hypothetical protein DRO32_04670 [Candidatus Bathyarchaeota archaeon]|nr:MAG: hypothetical protein DRO32_04670 [Candidatus Bathyarchaeota archaeon]
MVEAMGLLKGLTALTGEMPEKVREVVETSKGILRLFLGQMGLGEELLAQVVEALDHITVNFGVIRGGVKVNVVPDTCTLDVDVRVPMGLSPEAVKAKVDEMLKGAGLEEVECELVHASEPNFTSPSERIFRLLAGNAERILGLRVVPFFMTGASDARFLRLKGIPTIHYGPGELNKAHAYDEFVRTDHLIMATKVIAATIVDFLHKQGGT